MSGLPWESDRPLDEQRVARILARQFPNLSTSHVQYFASGWDNDCYLVESKWVFRFPKRQEYSDLVLMEIELLTRLSESIEIEVPTFQYFGKPDQEFPYPFVGYRQIPGVPLDPEEPVDEAVIWRQVGEALTAIHSIDPPARVPQTEWTIQQDIQELWKRKDEVIRDLPTELLPLWAPHLQGSCCLPPEFSGPCRVVHNDLGMEHILFDPITGRLTGIIDFADAEVGDPACDFAPFYYYYGESILEKILSHYGLPLANGFHERVRFIPHVRSPLWVADALRQGNPDDISKHLRSIKAYAARLTTG